MLQILEGWDLNTLDDAHRTHLVVEAMRRAYRDRTFSWATRTLSTYRSAC